MYNAGLYTSSKGINSETLHQIRDRYFYKRQLELARKNMEQLKKEKALMTKQ